MRRVDALEAKAMIDEGVTVIDVLPKSVYQQEHLPGARSVPMETFDPAGLDFLEQSTPVLVYCFDQH